MADDNPRVLESVSGLLSTDFDVVATATHGLQAVDLALRLQPDIVVLDVAMPEFDGFQTAHALRQHGSRARVVFLTMHRTDEFVSAAMSAGGADARQHASSTGKVRGAKRDGGGPQTALPTA